MEITVRHDVVAQLEAALDACADGEFDALPAADLADRLRRLGVVAARLGQVRAQVLAAVESRRRDGEFGTTTTAEVLASCVPVTAKRARELAGLAVATIHRASLIGEPLPAEAPALGAAMAAGTVGTDQALTILDTVQRVPDWADLSTAAIVESTLVGLAPTLHAHGLARAGRVLLAQLEQYNPDPMPKPERQRAQRGLMLRPWRDGLTRLVADLPPAEAELVRTVLESLAAPAPATSTATPTPESAATPATVADPQPAGRRMASQGDHGLRSAHRAAGASDDLVRDPRSARQRMADALVEACERLCATAALPATAGAPVTVTVTMTLADLDARRGVGLTGHGEPWPVADLLESARSAVFEPLVVGEQGTPLAGAPLYLGRSCRLASGAQRRSLIARDRGCSFPGCDRPPSWCQTHHVQGWAGGGPTDIDNLTLVCGHHHRTFAGQGWSVTVVAGHTEWTPPAWLDPGRHPLRNTMQHAPPPLPAPVGARYG